ncbi:alpha/beta fold hydrolase [Lentzea sp. JNUCC 0626]|uniref:alpha/beta fold hydrolase n=1 Tax=Lentzea sp. JNUCC 0626 TaxID=3367513 RepID=UPI00374899EA
MTSFPKPTLIPVNGVELEVFEAGTGTPVVLCHGWPEHAYSWRHQLPALAAAGHHVIAPNQRGYGNSSRPSEVTAYDIAHLTGDLIALLDHYGYADATFVGHDWGAYVVWALARLHPARVNKVINLSLPYPDRAAMPSIDFMESVLGGDNYFVHFNRHPGVADALFEANTAHFLRNLYRTPASAIPLIDLATAELQPGEPVLTEPDLAVLVDAFTSSGFTGGINWYRNFDRNWDLLQHADPVVHQSTLMIYGDRDTIPKSPNLEDFVPGVDVISLDCGHWIQEERPDETTQAITKWLAQED